MRYAEYPAAPRLAAVVDCFWILEAEGSGAQEPIMPDGRIEINRTWRATSAASPRRHRPPGVSTPAV